MTTTPPGTRTAHLADERDTARLAEAIGGLLAPADVVCLTGGLGAGKTSFARALIQARAGAALDVPSPTFTLAQVYPLPGLTLWHMDLYRLSDPGEVIELGWDDAVAEGAVLVEWPDRLGPLTPPSRLDLGLAFDDGTGRVATLTGHGPGWRRRLAGLGIGPPWVA